MSRAEKTRADWLATLAKFKHDPDRAANDAMWSPRLDAASRDELVTIQNEKLRVVTPFLYENSDFYRDRFDRLGLAPTDIASIEDLVKWPVVDKSEMTADVEANPPFGHYTTLSDDLWASRGWMLFSTSGTTGTPRVFRYSQIDREYWAWSNARAMHAMGFTPADTVFMMSGYGPHVWAWGVQMGLAKMGIGIIPGGGMDGKMRAAVVERFKPTVLCCTPSYALYLGRVMQDMGLDPSATSITKLFCAGEPAMAIDPTREKLEDLWSAKLMEFYGCTEAAPQAGGYACAASGAGEDGHFLHLMEDLQIWETIDPETHQPTVPGERGLSVCSNLISESSPQLRFLVGDFTTLNHAACACGRSHARAMGCFAGRADDLINLRGIKFFPTQIEKAVRAIAGLGDEFQIVLSSRAEDGMDVMKVIVEHPEHGPASALVEQVAAAVRVEIEVRVDVEVIAPDTLPKTEFKAKRVMDERVKDLRPLWGHRVC
ncbi:MAG: AMP-binding protein [Rhodospirillaceae bacterium]|jgi:phenylacetate-CoA ligase|nr:AMP-binding protein [Rhodospirillaceae bacterium]MBT5082377.1 AMP-binding protein [Rhodospirillaceae bacterium]MBT5524579.1 AMP-binding protein [Rhodospirillaceae bacterium]MBT5878554.1 AMP-binding protein [Rhodospirillaceae bacterium]MBT6588925.1 AMP-binding protein [Rhodospirillaceae bacterium]